MKNAHSSPVTTPRPRPQAIGPIFFFTLGLSLMVAGAEADVRIDATICNSTTEPVLYEFFHHNDALSAVPFTSTELHPCSCKTKRLNTDLWNNLPVATIRQLVFREVEGEDGYRFEVCVSSEGELEGYIKMFKATVKTQREVCFEAETSRRFESAPEITRARGDLPILETRMYHASKKCSKKVTDIFGGSTCKKYQATYDYDNGTGCYSK